MLVEYDSFKSFQGFCTFGFVIISLDHLYIFLSCTSCSDIFSGNQLTCILFNYLIFSILFIYDQAYEQDVEILDSFMEIFFSFIFLFLFFIFSSFYFYFLLGFNQSYFIPTCTTVFMPKRNKLIISYQSWGNVLRKSFFKVRIKLRMAAHKWIFKSYSVLSSS